MAKCNTTQQFTSMKWGKRFHATTSIHQCQPTHHFLRQHHPLLPFVRPCSRLETSRMNNSCSDYICTYRGAGVLGVINATLVLLSNVIKVGNCPRCYACFPTLLLSGSALSDSCLGRVWPWMIRLACFGKSNISPAPFLPL